MASTSSGEVEYFQFNPFKLPKQEHVLEFVSSRTSSSHGRPKNDLGLVVSEMTRQVRAIWSKADCPPKSIPSVKKMYTKLVQDKKALVRKKQRYELRKFDEKVWDILADEVNREGLTFDIDFYDEQRVTWDRKMEESVNPDYEEEIEDNNNLQQAKQGRIKSQYASFETASSCEVDLAIHKVSSYS